MITKEMIEMANAGDATVAASISDVVFKYLVKYAGRAFLSEDERQDLVQETYIIFLRKLQTYEYQGHAELLGYSVGILKNRIRDYNDAGKAPHKSLDVLADEPGTYRDALDLLIEKDGIAYAASLLQGIYYHTFLWCYIRGYTTRQAAVFLNMRHATVKTTYRRALKKLQLHYNLKK